MSTSHSLIVIGERLNTHREQLHTLVAARDAEAAKHEARMQVKAGATHLDINTSRGGAESEAADMLWMLETILPVLEKPIGIVVDSVRPDTLTAALDVLNERPGTILNASSAAPGESVSHCMDLASRFGTGIIVLLSPGSSTPGGEYNRVKRAEELRTIMLDNGIPDDRLFFDPQILPAAFEPTLPAELLGAIRELCQRWPKTHLAAGLSNVSFNMPNRELLNRTYLAMLLASGVDTVICNPRNKQIRNTLIAAQALLGKDAFFADYLDVFAPED